MSRDDAYDLYLEHMARTVLGLTELDHLVEVDGRGRRNRMIRAVARKTGYVIARPQTHDVAAIEAGIAWPKHALTMVGRRRLENIQQCIETVLADDVPGDWLEAGVWRGGASLFAKAVLSANGDTERTVWLADSFEGLPPPNAKDYPADEGIDLSGVELLAVDVKAVRNAFEWHGLLDERVLFVPGWFKDTLPAASVEKLAVLRLDGDLYESTMDTLRPLYRNVQPGGFVIVDDYGNVEACRKAVHDFRDEHGVTEPLIKIDDAGWFWRREEEA